jgi:DNA polymerase III subunit gamma/tau
MSYLVLARKYRSRDFQSLVGQEHVVQALANALTLKRLHHAYLFTGTRGVGKTSVSRILAKALNCTGPDGTSDITAQPCGVCLSCMEIDTGRFVDYVELDAASNRGVEEISQLLDQAVYKPVVGRFKVYMIDEVHMLSTTAFNAMLKTLEEPPDYLKFVLATTDPQKVPPTVLSRCLQFNLRPMAPATIQAHLVSVLAAEQIEAETAALRLLSRAANGSMRDALSLTDQAIAFGAGRLQETGVRAMLGAVDRSHAVRLVDALAAGQGAQIIAAVDDLRGLGLSGAGALEEMAHVLQQMAVLQAVPQTVDESDPDAPTVARLAGLLAADETQLLYSIALHGRAELALAPDEYSGLVMVLLRMLVFRPTEKLSAAPAPKTVAKTSVPLVATTTKAELRVLPRCAAPETEQSLLPSAHKGLDNADAATKELATPPELAALWAHTVQRLCDAGSITALVRELAMQASCVAMTPFDGTAAAKWHLHVAQAPLRAPVHQEKLQAALAELQGHPVQLLVDAGQAPDSPAQRTMAKQQEQQQYAEHAVQNDPMVQLLMQQFKTARIVPGSVKFHTQKG